MAKLGGICLAKIIITLQTVIVLNNIFGENKFEQKYCKCFDKHEIVFFCKNI